MRPLRGHVNRRPTTAELNRSRRVAAIGTIVGIALITFFVFTKVNPFSSPFQLTARFASAAQLSEGSQVRIAGIQVGQVTSIGAGPHDTASVTMSLSGNGLPVHSDATLTVTPRLALEGNAYLDLHPGTPVAPVLHSGATLPASQTAISVQVDQVLDVLNTPTRSSLQGTVSQLAKGFGPVAGSAYQGSTSLRNAVRQLAHALPPIRTAASALGGTSPGDLPRAVNATADFTTELAKDPAALADSVTSYNRFIGDLAAQDTALAGTIGDFDLLARAAPQPLTQLDSALPVLTHFSTTLRPSLEEVPASLSAASNLLQQIKLVVQPNQLPALLTKLSPVLDQAPAVEDEAQTMLTNAQPVTDCINTHIVPALSMTVPDGINTTGVPAYLDLVHAFAGLAGLGSDYDGNGGTVRLGVTTSERAIEGIIPSIGTVVGYLPIFSGDDPGYLGEHVNPAFRPDQSCATQKLPDLIADKGTVPSYASSSATINPADLKLHLLTPATSATTAPAKQPASRTTNPVTVASHPATGIVTPAAPATPSTPATLLSGTVRGILGKGTALLGCVASKLGQGPTGPSGAGTGLSGLVRALSGVVGVTGCAGPASGATGAQGPSGGSGTTGNSSLLGGLLGALTPRSGR